MEGLFTPDRIDQFRQVLAKLGYNVPDDELYDAIVAIIRFVAGAEDFRLKSNKGGINGTDQKPE